MALVPTPFRTPTVWKWTLPGLTWKGPDDGRTVYLTFDDGPIPEVTPWVLDQLDQHDAKATFFCIGDNVRKHPQVLRQVVARGHQVGNHGYHHIPWPQLSWPAYWAEIEACQEVLAAHGVVEVDMFRPPHGRINGAAAKRLLPHFRVVMWDFLTQDYNPELDLERAKAKVVKLLRPGSIVVFHDSLKALPQLQVLLPFVLDHMASRGWRSSVL